MEANQLTAEKLAAIREKWDEYSAMKPSVAKAHVWAELKVDLETDTPRLLATVEALRAENERLAKTLKEALMLLHRYTKSCAHDSQAIRGWMERTGAASLAHMSILREEPEA